MEQKTMNLGNHHESNLDGGFKYFLFSSLLGEMIQFHKYFSDGLKPPTSNELFGRKDDEWNNQTTMNLPGDGLQFRVP